MLTIKKPTTKNVQVQVLSFKWCGVVRAQELAKLKCLACRGKIGNEKRFGIAFIKDGNEERSMRLCNECAIKAEASNNSDAKEITKELALEIASRIWCDPCYSHVLMNPKLAERIALMLYDEAIAQENKDGV